jgi:hypothetical protein
MTVSLEGQAEVAVLLTRLGPNSRLPSFLSGQTESCEKKIILFCTFWNVVNLPQLGTSPIVALMLI